ncbi:dehydrodolichyl diphosphate synthase complex subunit nus1-like [Lineus longissimus]|uniref:dehydrodolichyl diphosphate synthase complex subunit nus1-like n=1 Tax=Lineus longissimus TaxID=88925 RepID=UPI002B4E2AF9
MMGFYNVLLFILHVLLYLRRVICNYLLYISRPIGLSFRKCTATQLRDDARSLKKLPIHLGILVTEDHISFSDIANIIVWSIAMDISCVSVYDIHGVCKGNKTILQHEIYKKQKEVEGSKYTNSQFIIANCDEEDVQNGYFKPGKSHIKLFSLEDGRKSIADLTRQLSRSVMKKEMKIEDITPTKVDCILQENLGCPDPNLVLKFGTTDSLLGYIPWQIRLGEILSYPSHHKIDYKTFFRLLDSYGNTNQRFGK